MFTNLENGYRVLNGDYLKGFAPCTSSEAKRYMGRVHLKRVSVGHYDKKNRWIEERIDYAWVSNKALGFWLPAMAPCTSPQPYEYAKRTLGNDCYLSQEVDGLFWVSKADAGLKIKAKVTYTGNKKLKLNTHENSNGDILFQYDGARKLIGQCHLETRKDGIYWVSDDVESVYVLAWTPTLKLDNDEKCFGA